MELCPSKVMLAVLTAYMFGCHMAGMGFYLSLVDLGLWTARISISLLSRSGCSE